MASVRTLFALAAATILITFTPASAGTVTIHADSYAYERVPDRVMPDFARHLGAFDIAPRGRTFPLELVADSVERAPLVAGAGPGRCSVTPGRDSAVRQSVPARSRRKVRVWERDVA